MVFSGSPRNAGTLCLTLGETLCGPAVTYDMAQRAIATVEPAMEISEVRGDFKADMPLSITDNCQQKAFVTAAPSAFGVDVALNQARVEVRFNGQQRATAIGAEVMGNPVHSAVWLADKLAEYGVVLESGMRIMSGSFTQQFAASRGDAVVSRFTPFGVVEVAFD